MIRSNSVEGINTSDEDAITAIDGEDPASTDRDTWQAVVGYRDAMDHILQRRQSPSFEMAEDVLLAVRFMICQSDLTAGPACTVRVGLVYVIPEPASSCTKEWPATNWCPASVSD